MIKQQELTQKMRSAEKYALKWQVQWAAAKESVPADWSMGDAKAWYTRSVKRK